MTHQRQPTNCLLGFKMSSLMRLSFWQEMRGVLTTQIQNGYREQFQKEMLTRLAWKSRYSKFYPTCKISQDNKMEDTQLPADAL